METTTILLIDCNPSTNTGETLEAMLASARLGQQLRREVVVDPGQIKFDRSWIAKSNDHGSSLIFLVLPRKLFAQGAALLQALTKAEPQIPIIIVVEACLPTETLELLRRGAADYLTSPLRFADTLPRVWRLLDQLDHRESVSAILTERVGPKRLIGQTAAFVTEVKKIPLIAKSD